MAGVKFHLYYLSLKLFETNRQDVERHGEQEEGAWRATFVFSAWLCHHTEQYAVGGVHEQQPPYSVARHVLGLPAC